jgi:hypothetical protein
MIALVRPCVLGSLPWPRPLARQRPEPLFVCGSPDPDLNCDQAQKPLCVDRELGNRVRLLTRPKWMLPAFRQGPIRPTM